METLASSFRRSFRHDRHRKRVMPRAPTWGRGNIGVGGESGEERKLNEKERKGKGNSRWICDYGEVRDGDRDQTFTFRIPLDIGLPDKEKSAKNYPAWRA